jgi:hypothetical protein
MRISKFLRIGLLFKELRIVQQGTFLKSGWDDVAETEAELEIPEPSSGVSFTTGGDMAERKQLELEPPRKLKVRTIQTVRFGKSKVNIKLADKTLRKIMKERESKGLAS